MNYHSTGLESTYSQKQITVDTTTQPDVQWDLDLASNWQSAQQAWGTNFGEWNNSGAASEREVSRRFHSFDGTENRTNGNGTETHGALDEVEVETSQDQVRTGTRLNVDVFNRTQRSGPFLTRVDIIPFMRSRLIQFRGTGMKPNTRVFPFFDNVLVNDFVAPTNDAFANTGTLGTALETNANGDVFGVFLIPNTNSLRFRQGERPFRLVDIANTSTQAGTETTSASTNYTYLV